jgi:hypothetical protein
MIPSSPLSAQTLDPNVEGRVVVLDRVDPTLDAFMHGIHTPEVAVFFGRVDVFTVLWCREGTFWVCDRVRYYGGVWTREVTGVQRHRAGEAQS